MYITIIITIMFIWMVFLTAEVAKIYIYIEKILEIMLGLTRLLKDEVKIRVSKTKK